MSATRDSSPLAAAWSILPACCSRGRHLYDQRPLRLIMSLGIGALRARRPAALRSHARSPPSAPREDRARRRPAQSCGPPSRGGAARGRGRARARRGGRKDLTRPAPGHLAAAPDRGRRAVTAHAQQGTAVGVVADTLAAEAGSLGWPNRAVTSLRTDAEVNAFSPIRRTRARLPGWGWLPTRSSSGRPADVDGASAAAGCLA